MHVILGSNAASGALTDCAKSWGIDIPEPHTTPFGLHGEDIGKPGSASGKLNSVGDGSMLLRVGGISQPNGIYIVFPTGLVD